MNRPEVHLNVTSLEERVLLDLEQGLLPLDATGVPGEGAVGPDHPVAGDHDRDRVAAVGQPDRARGGVGLAEAPRALAVRRRLAGASPQQLPPDRLLEGAAA